MRLSREAPEENACAQGHSWAIFPPGNISDHRFQCMQTRGWPWKVVQIHAQAKLREKAKTRVQAQHLKMNMQVGPLWIGSRESNSPQRSWPLQRRGTCMQGQAKRHIGGGGVGTVARARSFVAAETALGLARLPNLSPAA